MGKSAKPQSSEELLDQLAESYVERHRAGERPSITEYIEEYPELESEIRNLFEALVMVEGVDLDIPSDASGQSPVPPSPPLKGKLGEYRLEREIGRGGMGTVYEAAQESLDRRVAIKVLSRDAVSEPQALKRFHREAQSVARLQHPNIVPVFGVGEDQGVHYFAMQLVSGQSLDRIIVELRRLKFAEDSELDLGPRMGNEAVCRKELDSTVALVRGDGSTMNSDQRDAHSMAVSSHVRSASSGQSQTDTFYHNVARIGVQTADALHYAHEHRVLHRDIKPSNLMLDLVGHVWVADFGLARLQDSGSMTHSAELVGTLRYMPPERFNSESDLRGDVYSLGLTLYELIALEPAFAARDRGQLIRDITQSKPRLLSDVAPKIPHDLETILLKSFRRDPADRYQTTKAFADDLRRFLAGEPIVARRTPIREQVVLWCKRNPGTAFLTLSLMVLMLVAGIGSATAAILLAQANRRTLDSLEEEILARDKATRSEELALHALYEARVAQARAGRFSGRPGQRIESLDAIQKAAAMIPRLKLGRTEKVRLRNEAIACMSLFDLQLDTQWPIESAVSCVDYDVSRFAYWDSKSRSILIRDMNSGERLTQLQVHDGFKVDNKLRFSFDGLFLAAVGRNSKKRAILVWRCDHPHPILNSAKDSPFVEHSYGATFRFLQNSQQLALIRSDHVVEIIDLDASRPVKSYPVGEGSGHLWLDVEATRIAVFRKGQIEIIDLKTGTVLNSIVPPQTVRHIYSIDWSPDGRTLTAATSDKNAYAWETDTGVLIETLEGHSKEVTGMGTHPQANLRKSFSNDGTTRFWMLPTGDQLLRVHKKIFNFSNDGRWAAARSGRFRLFVPNEHRVLFQPRAAGARNRAINRFAVHPGGRLLVVGNYAQLMFWDLATMQLVGGKNIPGSSPFFNADGTKLHTLSESGTIRVHHVHFRETDGELQIGPGRLLTPTQNTLTRKTSTEVNPGSPRTKGRYVSMHVNRRRHIVRLLNTESQELRHWVVKHDGLWDCNITGNGDLFATSTFHGRDVKLWDGDTGRCVKTIRSGHAKIQFTPDGQKLAVSESGRCSFYEVKTGKLLHQTAPSPAGDLPGPVCISADGEMAAFRGKERHTIKLMRISTFEDLASIELPDDQMVDSIHFSPDGGYLLVSPNRPMLIHVWDLRKIRASLGKLDWDGPALSNPTFDASKPLHVEFLKKPRKLPFPE